MRSHPLARILLLAAVVLAAACSGGSNDVAGPENTVQVVMNGSGTGRVVSGGNFIDCPSTCGPSDWTPGVTVELVATPDVDSKFVQWSGACSGSDPNACSFVVSGHMLVTATFDKL